MTYNRIVFYTLIIFSSPALAEWDTVIHTNIDNNLQTRVANSENDQGFKLEIYRDINGAIRSRFSMNSTYRLQEKNCPTYQVDKRGIQNRSINDAPCISNRKWVEFVLGYIEGNRVTSTPLYNIINGTRITYYFILENSGYLTSSFSLAGSKQALLDALGKNIEVLP
jgi:hypothetical protein